MGPGVLTLVDSTGFSAETVVEILQQKKQIPSEASEWSPSELFATSSASLPQMLGLMLGIRELALQTDTGDDNQRLADVLSDWVTGKTVADIAASYYSEADITKSLTKCCSDLFRRLLQNSAWGTGALLALSELDLLKMSPEQAEQVRSVPAMLFYGVSSVHGVLMRTLEVPRSIAMAIGEQFKAAEAVQGGTRISKARQWLLDLPATNWESARPQNAQMSGDDYRRVWRVLNGMDENG